MRPRARRSPWAWRIPRSLLRGGPLTSPRKTRVAVVFGGRSTEHAISCVSAGSILAALDPDEFDVVPVGITREGRWVLTSGDRSLHAIVDRRLPEITAASGQAVVLPADPTGGGSDRAATRPTGPRALAGVDVVFPVAARRLRRGRHDPGPAGDGRRAVRRARTCSPPPPRWTRSSPRSSPPPRASRSARTRCCAPGSRCPRRTSERLGLPVFVKPSRAGSSYGISKVDRLGRPGRGGRRGPGDRPEGAGRGRDHRPRDRVRRAGGRARRRAGGLAARRGPGGRRTTSSTTSRRSTSTTRASTTSPRGLPDRVTKQIQEYACRTFTALDCAGPGPGRLLRHAASWTSTSTRSTRCRASPPTSMFPRMWAATGLDYPKLVSRLIRTALAPRHRPALTRRVGAR